MAMGESGMITLDPLTTMPLTPSQIRFIDKLQPGQRATGMVRSFRDFGAMISIGMVQGLLHNTDIRWSRVDAPEHFLRIGQKLEVLILHVDREKLRFTVGLKQLMHDPWESFLKRHGEGDLVSGTVARVFSYGVLFEIVGGVQALWHVSEMEQGAVPEQLYREDEVYQVTILKIDAEARRIAVCVGD